MPEGRVMFVSLSIWIGVLGIASCWIIDTRIVYYVPGWKTW